MKKIEGEISPEENARLYELLEQNQEALDIYVDLAILYSSLTRSGKISPAVKIEQDIASEQLDHLLLELSEAEKGAEPLIVDDTYDKPQDVVPKAEFDSSTRKISKTSIFSLVLSAAAILLMALFIHFTPVQTNSPVAILSRTIDAQWLDSSGTVHLQGDLYPGPLHLTKGYAEIHTDNGSQIILQAPVELDLESDSQMLLRRGHITVRVSPGDSQYVVRTPTASIVDFGTEFGVYVSQSNETLTHVYEGEVELRSGSNPLRFENVLKLKKGQGGQADDEGRLSEKDRIWNLFVRSEEFEIKLTAAAGTPYQRWLSYSYQLRRDPDLVLYYPFMKPDESATFAVNYALNTKEALNGSFGGSSGISNFTPPSWVDGRWPDKAALIFQRDQRNCISVAPSPELNLTREITLAAWVRCPESQKGGHIFSNRAEEQVNYQFGCFSEEDPYYAGKLQFLRTGDAFSQLVYSSKHYRWTSDWTFLAVTHDTHTVRFYINGQLYESIPFTSDQNPVPASLFIGDVPATGGKTFGYAAFNGLMDELVILKRAMTAQEIQQMYQAGKP